VRAVPAGNVLGASSPSDFLERCWQKRPKLIRGALPGFRPFIDRRGLFRLAARDDVESRLVLEQGGEYPWQVLHGPFSAARLRRLPARHWSLLVQNVDLHCLEGAMLLRRFSFLPGWRIDDLMISCAPPGGSVGPHIDSYDVFLLQAAGERLWRIGRDQKPEFVEGLDLRILRRFRPAQEWLLRPGDMLYLPPGVAHHGIAAGDCMTFSIGFRAPDVRELAIRRIEEQATADGELLFRDPGRRPQQYAGEITRTDRTALRRLLHQAAGEERTFDEWFGCQVTQLPECIRVPRPSRPLDGRRFTALFRKHGRLLRAAPCRAAFVRKPSGVVLFVNGRAVGLPAGHLAFAQRFSGDGVVGWSVLPRGSAGAPLLALLRGLYNDGLLVPP
jgi:50S ribosomal protein L16 3-hydroxylase